MRRRLPGGEHRSISVLEPLLCEQQVSTATSSRIKCLNISNHGPYVVTGSSSGVVVISKTGAPRDKAEFSVEVHELPVTAVSLWNPLNAYDGEEHEGHLLLASCCRAFICLSRVAPGLTGAALVWRYPLSTSGAQTASPIQACFDPISAFLLAVAVGREVFVLRVGSGDILARLQGHAGEVTSVLFDPLRTHILSSCSEDGIVKVWNLSARACIHQTARGKSSPDPLTCLATHPTGRLWCVSGSEGRLTIYHCQHSTKTGGAGAIDCSQQQVHLTEAFSVQLPHPDRVRSLDDRPDFEHRVEASVTVLAMGFTVQPQEGATATAGGGDEEATVVVATTEGLVMLGCRSGRIRALKAPAPFGDCAPFSYAAVGPHTTVLASALQPLCVAIPTPTGPLPGPARRSSLQSTNQGEESGEEQNLYQSGIAAGLIASGVAIPAAASLVRQQQQQNLRGWEVQEEEDVGEEHMAPLSLFPSPTQPVPSWSPLAAVFQNQTTTPTKKEMAYNHYEGPSITKKVPLLHDRPVVFHARIKSSGYGAKPSSKSPSAVFKKSPTALLSQQASRASPGSSKKQQRPSLAERRYPLDCAPLTRPQPQHDATPPMAAILSLAYTGNDPQGGSVGTSIVAGTINGGVHVIKLPVSKHQGEGYLLSGHTSAVRHVSPSHNQGMILSSSDDGTTRLWAPHLCRKSAAVVMKPPPSSSSSSSFSSIPQALFYYLDKFVLLASGRCVYLYRYQLDILAKDALIRQPAKGRSKSVHSWSLDHAQKVTALDAFNTILSPTIVTAASDRSLSVLDAAHGKIVRVLHDAHAKAVHSVVLPKPSAFAPLPTETLDVFTTAATDNCVTLWDVRTRLARVMSFRDHVNRRERVGLALSPCMRYLAAGSEDRCLILNDLRTGRVLSKLPCHDDVVSAATFHPLHPQMATAGYDGRIHFLTAEE